MDAKALFGYVMLYRVQAYLHVVVDEAAAEFVQDHRYWQFVLQDAFDIDVAQELEQQLNSHITARYVTAVNHDEWLELTRAAQLRAAMNAKFAAGSLLQ
jgi:hypothetical protein